mgnify:CR=1 FL=1
MKAQKLKLLLLAGSATFALGGCTFLGNLGFGNKPDTITPSPTPTPTPTPVPPPPPPPPPPPMPSPMPQVTGQMSRMMVMRAPVQEVIAPNIDREQYEDFDENPIKSVAKNPVSTFSIDVDTASQGCCPDRRTDQLF